MRWLTALALAVLGLPATALAQTAAPAPALHPVRARAIPAPPAGMTSARPGHRNAAGRYQTAIVVDATPYLHAPAPPATRIVHEVPPASVPPGEDVFATYSTENR